MFLRFNAESADNAQWELVNEDDQVIQSVGYLELSMIPSNAGDRVNGLVFVATDVLLPDATPTPIVTDLS